MADEKQILPEVFKALILSRHDGIGGLAGG